MIGPVRVFAVDHDQVQLDWPWLPAGELMLSADGLAPMRVEVHEGPGVLEVHDLQPATTTTLRIRHGDDLDAHLEVRTLAAPPGAELARVATISDVHVGSKGFGLRNSIPDDDPEDPHSLRCARAAIAEATEWGAELLVVKGDLTNNNLVDEWAAAGELLAECDIPVRVLAGNHDGYEPDGHADADVAAREAGFDLVRGVQVQRVGPLSVVLVDTTIAGRGHGTVAHVRADVVDAVHGTTPGALVLQHHQVQPLPFAHHWPPGIPSTEGLPYLREVARAQPNTLVSSGHTHRNRRLRHQVLTLTEVGAVKDYPGVWAGYVVHEGGIRQVVRRVAAPPALRWTERTGDAIGGMWRLWSPGTLSDRCMSVRWKARPGATS